MFITWNHKESDRGRRVEGDVGTTNLYTVVEDSHGWSAYHNGSMIHHGDAALRYPELRHAIEVCEDHLRDNYVIRYEVFGYDKGKCYLQKYANDTYDPLIDFSTRNTFAFMLREKVHTLVRESVYGKSKYRIRVILP